MTAYTGMKILGAAARIHSSTVMLLLDKSGIAYTGYHTRQNLFSAPFKTILPNKLKLSAPGLLICTGGNQLDFYWVDTKSGNPLHIYSLDSGQSWTSSDPQP